MQTIALPVELPIWGLVGFKATRAEMRAMLGPPHYVETDPRRTCGGEEDVWAYKLSSGQRVLVLLDVTRGWSELYGDPPQIGPILEAFAIPVDDARLRHHEPFEMK
jgi:hypothetical protein